MELSTSGITKGISYMQVINGQIFYDDSDISQALSNLAVAENSLINRIYLFIQNGGYGIDTIPLLNIVTDPEEFSIDYMMSLDSDVTEEFIKIMQIFGMI